MRSDTIITILDRDLIRTDTIRCVLVRESQELIRYVAIVYDCWLDFWRLWPRLCHDKTPIGISTSKTNIYLITFLISEDETTLMEEQRMTRMRHLH